MHIQGFFKFERVTCSIYKMAGSDGNEKQFSFLYLPQEEIANEVELNEEDNQDNALEESRNVIHIRGR